MIEVILMERIERLGQLGQVVKVRPGYARNYLLPLNKALRATKSNLDVFEKKRAELEAKNAADRATAQDLATKIDGLKVVVIRQASEMGQLYGSVSARDVADAAKEAGHTIDRSQVVIDTPIKALGLYQVKVKLHPEVTVKVTVNVARSTEEAVVQAEMTAAAATKAEAPVFIDAPAEATESTDEAPAKKPRKAKKDDAEASAEAPKAKKPRAKKSEG